MNKPTLTLGLLAAAALTGCDHTQSRTVQEKVTIRRSEYDQLLGKAPFRGIGFMITNRTGEVVVDFAVEGLPAEKAGIVGGDIVTAVEGEAIEYDVHKAEKLIEECPRDEVSVTILREGKTMTFRVPIIKQEARK